MNGSSVSAEVGVALRRYVRRYSATQLPTNLFKAVDAGHPIKLDDRYINCPDSVLSGGASGSSRESSGLLSAGLAEASTAVVMVAVFFQCS